MTKRTLIKRSLRFHWRSHLGVVLGAAIGSAALIGALIVGDSVRETLRERAVERLGRIAFAMSLSDRFVTQELADDMPGSFSGLWHEDKFKTVYFVSVPAAALSLSSIASTEDGSARANHVNVIGAIYPHPQGRMTGFASFWEFGSEKPVEIKRGEVWLNESLAAQLRAKPGDTVVLRVHKPSALSRDTPIAPRADASVALRLRVVGVRSARGMGNFSLRASQSPPLNAFVNLEELQQATVLAHKVNVLLSPGVVVEDERRTDKVQIALETIGLQRLAKKVSLNKTHEEFDEERAGDLNGELRDAATLGDYELSLHPSSNNTVELTSSRIFLEPPFIRAATNPEPAFWRIKALDVLTTTNDNWTDIKTLSHVTNARPILTYLVNLLQAGERAAPYSMVTAAGAPFTPPDMKDDEILVNDWLAADLQVKPGDAVALNYFVADSGAQLIERTNFFRVRAVVPMTGIFADRSLMPEFPGIAKAESTHDWDAGFPLVHPIRPQDETYWKQHRGTPKAFVTLAAGQRMWANRFGNLTALRWPLPDGTSLEISSGMLKKNLLNNVDPSEVGLRFETVREQALKAAEQSQDFGGLFIGFSFFLIVAALILMGLLFAFGVQQRAEEIGTLLALGFTAKQVRKLFLLEGAALAFIGSILGVIGGIVYARAMLHGLTTVWKSATNTGALTFHVSAVTILTGLVSGTLVALVTIWLVLRKQARQPARALLAGEWRDEFHESKTEKSGTRSTRLLRWKRLFAARWIAWGSLTLTLATVASAFAMHETSNPEYFFSAGSFALIAGLAFTSSLLGKMLRRETTKQLSASVLSVRGAARRKSRSVATVALLACGVFLIVAIGAFRLDANVDAWKRSSGTGGFALIAESTLPILKDLNTKEGRDALGLDEKILQGVSFVPFRVREGDDASCLNLNRAQQPRLLGLNPRRMRFEQFTFASILEGAEGKHGDWDVLSKWELPDRASIPSNRVPAVGDAASIQWALHKKIGETVSYQDERGEKFEAWLTGGLANSILQGSLIIDEAEFTKHFPSISGYRMFLIDCQSNAVPQVSAELTRALQDFGFEVTPAAQRLAEFNAVQNTYLNTFQVLGGLGLLLGSFGLGIVVLRNVLERRGELALLIAVGFRQARVQKLVLVEHAALLCLGLVIGIVSALVAILPSLLSPRAELPVQSLALTLGGVLLFGMLATWLATRTAVRGNLLEGLRNE